MDASGQSSRSPGAHEKFVGAWRERVPWRGMAGEGQVGEASESTGGGAGKDGAV